MTVGAISERDKLAKEYGLLVGIENELYTVQVSRYGYVFVELLNGYWTSRREQLTEDKKGAIWVKDIARSKSLKNVLEQTLQYTDYLKGRR